MFALAHGWIAHWLLSRHLWGQQWIRGTCVPGLRRARIRQ